MYNSVLIQLITGLRRVKRRHREVSYSSGAASYSAPEPVDFGELPQFSAEICFRVVDVALPPAELLAVSPSAMSFGDTRLSRAGRLIS